VEPDGRGTPEVPLSGWNRRGLAGVSGSPGRSLSSIGSLTLFRGRPWRYSTHERGRMSRHLANVGSTRLQSLESIRKPSIPGRPYGASRG
jgi:hypothetical protein